MQEAKAMDKKVLKSPAILVNSEMISYCHSSVHPGSTGDGSLCSLILIKKLLLRASQGTVLGNTAGVTENRPL